MADPQAARAWRAADRERVADLAARIIDLECSIRALRVEKELLEAEQDIIQDRLSANTYPVLTLPPELVSEIFEHFVPVYPKRAPQKGLLSPITLCQICRLWREIAFSTPLLWRTFKIFLRPGGSVQNKEADHQTELSLQRSGSFPLSLIIAHRARWQHLKLFVSPRNLGAIIGLFPLLESLTIMTTNGLHPSAYRPATFHSAPLLRRVAIDSYKDIFLDMLPWSQLTVLVFKLIGMSQCLRILVLVPNLVDSDLTFSRLGEGDTPRVLTLPALQRLHIDEEFLHPDPIAVLRSLLSHWGSSPQEICIGFPVLAIHLYSAALPSIVFSSIRRDPLPIQFLDQQPTNLMGLEAANIDEEGEWWEASSSESEESTPDSGEESDSSESGEKYLRSLVKSLTRKKETLTTIRNNQARRGCVNSRISLL
ncbi:hypothetical protein B0H16DRAFT_1896708 [Mycena metata]|uniref:F-box domain-containing protein n=1 Tax=Mycena metata TaxID=1033252 RepID=A0AAD7HHK7_9AGAR|nr:hypothetical protein B0H16DRAFT_1896708 [Mycena metata]